MFGELILPLLQQISRHDNEGGLDGHRLPLVMIVLVQVVDRPGSRCRVGQDEHQALEGFAQALAQADAHSIVRIFGRETGLDLQLMQDSSNDRRRA